MLCEDRKRRFYRCARCRLVFADPASRPSREAEKRVYDLHENDPGDQGYRRFLNRLAAPLLERLGDPPQEGLDFGSGPGPTLSVMLEEAGHRMSLYDPFYAPDRSVLERQYDFVTCSEAVEHFHRPDREWRLLCGLVRPGGLLAVMTQMVPEDMAFRAWGYKRDLTHVSFFDSETFRYLARRDGLRCEIVGRSVVLMRIPEAS
ncbi:MAG: class I SAM-dependent methyltransferase [Synergistales bacterium]|nr:class I SAM-dependent methyltransferase [Synergistales bacterium]